MDFVVNVITGITEGTFTMALEDGSTDGRAVYDTWYISVNGFSYENATLWYHAFAYISDAFDTEDDGDVRREL